MSDNEQNTRRALVTGVTGYIGQRLAVHLLAHGWEVHALVRPTSKTAPYLPCHVYDGTRSSLEIAFARSAPTVVVHVASAVVVEHSACDTDPMIEANVRLPTLLLDVMREGGVSRFINTGTSWQHFNNETCYEPTNLYAATKQAFEDIAKYFVSAHEFNFVTLKLMDVYGPQDERRKVIPLLLGLLQSDARLAMSPGEQVIDLVHVDDVVEAYRLAAELVLRAGPGYSEAFAVGSGEARSLRAVVELFQDLAGRSLNIEWGARPYRAREVMTAWSGDRALPGWRPRWELEAGLKDVLAAERNRTESAR